MNALGSFVQDTLQAAAPEAYKAGQTDRMNSQISNALAQGNVSGAAQAAYGANDWQTGMKLGAYGQEQESAQRQQEAQGVLNLFSAAQPAQISEMAMTDPVGFERMTGMSSDEYMQAGQRMAQAGLSPEQFHQYVIQKAQAELGMESQGPMEINNQLVDPKTYQVLGDYRTPEVPEAPDKYIDVPASELPPGTPPGLYKRNLTTNNIERVAGPPSAGVTVNTGDGKLQLSPLEKKMDEYYADTLVNWNTGGQSDWQKNQTQINNIADALENGGENLTGYLIGITPKWALEGINPEAVDAQEQVEEVVQRNLRIVLGAQFTQKEGERLIERAYNRRLPPEKNAARVRRLAQLLEGRAQQLQSLNEYVRQNRTAAGWNGTLTSVDQMLDDLDQISGGSNSPINDELPAGFVEVQ